MQLSSGFKYFLWVWRNLLSRHKSPPRKKKPQKEQQLCSPISGWMRPTSSGARMGSNCDFTPPVTPRNTNALRPPRSDPQSVRLWKVCRVRETGGVRMHPSSCKAELTSSPPEPSTFYHERHSSSSLFPALRGNGQHRRTAGTTQHETAPPRRDSRSPSATPARPGRAEQQPRLRSLAQFSAPGTAEAAVASSARRCPA